MVATPEIRVTTSAVRTVVQGVGDGVRATKAAVRSIINFPTLSIRATNAVVRNVSESIVDIRVTQALVRSIVRGRVDDPSIRVFTFTLDEHDYYVIRLGEIETLVYDTFAQQWYVWGTRLSDRWRANTGCNWLGGDRFAAAYGSNIVVGDEGNGSLYFLDPDRDIDDAPADTGETYTFERIVQGQVLTKGYASAPCFGVQLLGSIGQQDADVSATVNLSVSDDRGNTYTDSGTLTLDSDSFGARASWRSLGSILAPGRLFKVTDYGSLKRIDSLDMEGEGE